MVEVLVEEEHYVQQYLRAHIELAKMSGHTPDTVWEFILKHGRAFEIGPKTYKGRRKTPKQCFANCTHMALRQRAEGLFYVEGYVAVYGVPIHHAWLTTAKGELIDPTINNHDGRTSNYFGVVFDTDYVWRATKINDSYGLLDHYHNRKTLPDLLEGRSDWQPKGFKP